ncbi:hypothetical protein P0136_06555 [Lentisphaerota bacterium ZTH]|nr:hypothetical protein JYG24_02335 [Lentisphaerota bacterium]WET07650.1 hypothetical protein P0136_06555 [Lentisphaerota bacterium ZTH]
MKPSFAARLLFVIFSCAATVSTAAFKPAFSATEHIYGAAEVMIKLNHDSPGIKNPVFTLPNGLRISYGQLAAMPDLFSVVGNSASDTRDPVEAEERFLRNFNDLAESSQSVTRFNKIWPVMQDEYEQITAAVEKGLDPAYTFQKISGDIDERLNRATGGGSIFTGMYPLGNYLKLAVNCFDHFGEDAIFAYHIGHNAAMKAAVLAGKIERGAATPSTSDIQKYGKDLKLIALNHLEYAYALNAFACHYMMDRFAGGHIRAPFRQLCQTVFTQNIGACLGKYAHNEDCCDNLIVRNQLGETWTAYGDHEFFSDCNRENRARLAAMLQQSADEVFDAYTTGCTAAPENTDRHFPYPVAPLTEFAGFKQTFPMFRYDKASNTIFRREDIANQFDSREKSDWWGWSTFLLINSKGMGKNIPPEFSITSKKNRYNVPVADQAVLFDRTENKQQLIDEGIITDPGLLEYHHKQDTDSAENF